jgi:hypothetical protein
MSVWDDLPMVITLGTVLAPVTVTTPELGERTDLGLIAQPGHLMFVKIPITDSAPMRYLLSRGNTAPADLFARGDAVLAIAPGEVNNIDVRRAGVVRRTARVRIHTPRGEVVIERAKDPDEQLLARAMQRAFGFATVSPWTAQSCVFGLRAQEPPPGAGEPWGLVFTPDGLRLFEYPPMGIGDRLKGVMKTVGEVVADTVAASANSTVHQTHADIDGPTTNYRDAELSAYIKGTRAPTAPAALGGEGRVTAVVLFERDPTTISIDATVDGRIVKLQVDPIIKVALHHLVGCALGTAAVVDL